LISSTVSYTGSNLIIEGNGGVSHSGTPGTQILLDNSMSEDIGFDFGNTTSPTVHNGHRIHGLNFVNGTGQ